MHTFQEPRPGALVQSASRRGFFLVAAMFVLGSMAAGVVCFDRLTLECSRAQDRCTFQSVGVLQGGTFEGQVRLSEVDFLGTDAQTTRTAPSRTFTKLRHVFVLKNQTRVPLEPRLRSVLAGDLIPEQFQAFQRAKGATLATSAIHFGHLGFFLPTLVAIAGVLVMTSETRDVLFDRATGRFHVRIRGVRSGRRDAEGLIEEIAAIEHVPLGSFIGTYLVLRDGRRIRMDANHQDTLARDLASRLGLPLTSTTSDAIAKTGLSSSLGPALLVLFVSFLPLLLQGAWGALIVLWGLSYR